MTSFKDRIKFADRKKEGLNMREKYPDRIPAIVERHLSCKSIPTIDKIKYLVPAEFTVGMLNYVIRKKIKMNPNQAMFMFINNEIVPTSQLISAVYDQYKEDDFFLYFSYAGENTYG